MARNSTRRPRRLLPKLEHLLENQKKLEKQVAALSTQLASSDLEEILNAAVEVGGVPVLAAQIPLDSPKTLREVGDKVRDKMGTGIAVLGGTINGKAALLAIVSKDLTGRFKAGEVVKKWPQSLAAKVEAGRIWLRREGRWRIKLVTRLRPSRRLLHAWRVSRRLLSWPARSPGIAQPCRSAGNSLSGSAAP